MKTIEYKIGDVLVTLAGVWIWYRAYITPERFFAYYCIGALAIFSGWPISIILGTYKSRNTSEKRIKEEN